MYQSPEQLDALFEELARAPKCAAEIAERLAKCEQALQCIKREKQPEQWARLQSEVGYCLAEAPTESPAQNLKKAIEHYDAALEVYTASVHADAWAITQYELASAYYGLASVVAAGGQRSLEATAEQLEQHLQEAINHYEQAVTVWTRQDWPEEWALLQESIADACQAQPRDRDANLKEALHYYEQALEVLDRSDHEAHWARIQHQMGTIWLRAMPRDRSEGLRKAIAHFKKALAVRQQNAEEQFQEWADTQLSLAIAYMEHQSQDQAENIERAIELCKKIVERPQCKGHGDLEGEAWSNLANAQNRRIRGDRGVNLERAIRCYQKAIGRQQGTLKGRSLHNLGLAFTRRIRGDRLDNLKSAIQYYQDALDLLPQELLPMDSAAVQRDLADAHWQLGRHWKRDDPMESERCLMKGIEHAEEASRIYTEQKLEAERAGALYIMGNLHAEWPTIHRLAHLWEAILYYQESLASRSPQTSPVQYAETLNSLGVTYWELGQHATAIRHFGEAFDIHHKLGNRRGERRVGANLALLHYGRGDWPKAHQALERVLGLVESMRADALGDLGQVDIARENTRLYEMMIDTCLHLGPEHYGQALEAVEANKARAFLRDLGADGVPPPPVPESHQEVLRQERQLVEHVRDYEKAMRDAQDTTERSDWMGEQETALIDLRQAWDALEPVVADYVALRRGDPVRYGQVQELLAEMANAALVEFYTRPEETVIFVLREKEKSVVQVPMPSERLRRCISTFQREVVEYPRCGDIGRRMRHLRPRRTEHPRRSDIGQGWQDLAQPLLRPVLPLLTGADLVYFVPHGPLHLLPLHALKVDGCYPIDLFRIVYAPSAAILIRLLKRTKPGKGQKRRSAFVAGNPTLDLPHSEDEAIQVARHLGVSPMLGKHATKAAIVRDKLLEDKDVGHFACHGQFDSAHPLDSGLVLHDHAILTTREIMQLRLDADLITLSACRTGQSEVYTGDELVGLPRAFLQAGASSVLVSLWGVQDQSTGQFMIEFYDRLYNDKGGRATDKAAALKATMTEMRSHWTHPYHWAPFALVGHWK